MTVDIEGLGKITASKEVLCELLTAFIMKVSIIKIEINLFFQNVLANVLV